MDELRLRKALRVYLVADPDQCHGNFIDSVRLSLQGGVTMVQLRAKSISDREIVSLARQLQPLCREVGAAFLINDRIDLALASDADGVHLGVDDLPLADARRIAPSGFLLGFSPESIEGAEEARVAGASYLGIGPVFTTTTKVDAGEALGFSAFQDRLRAGGLPSIGIGGVSIPNAAAVILAGADGVAVISAILKSNDPLQAARSLRTEIDTALAQRAG